jgi:hypothetical protein
MQQAIFSSLPTAQGLSGSTATTFLGTPVSVQSCNPKSHATSCENNYEDPYNPVQQEQAMWRSVIVQALMDAASTSQKTEALIWKREAQIWLRGNSQDFHTVCFYADFDPDFIREIAAKALAKIVYGALLPVKAQ